MCKQFKKFVRDPYDKRGTLDVILWLAMMLTALWFLLR